MNDDPETYEGRCMKCKGNRTFVAAEIAVMKNGAEMAKGPCPDCGTTVCRILPKAKS